ncbi:hypothetical protein EYF80_001523 [Liparis tanakae]|uniref:Uncharacterized protein n=1 Tax=Liparis tanakae TaxID=230148 RepID=A0A4Z2JEA3_9TELE|nr:hypothetical protein EYF80_001523 [Liparis tanakae]
MPGLQTRLCVFPALATCHSSPPGSLPRRPGNLTTVLPFSPAIPLRPGRSPKGQQAYPGPDRNPLKLLDTHRSRRGEALSVYTALGRRRRRSQGCYVSTRNRGPKQPRGAAHSPSAHSPSAAEWRRCNAPLTSSSVTEETGVIDQSHQGDGGLDSSVCTAGGTLARFLRLSCRSEALHLLEQSRESSCSLLYEPVVLPGAQRSL